MRPLIRLLAPCLLLLAACEDDFAPETRVEGLRILGVRATPAELGPGETARLAALVVDPSRPGQRSTTLWLACDPDPFNLGRSACSDTAALSDPTTLVQPSPDGGTPTLPPGMRVVGINDFAAYAAPADLFSQLPVDDPRRRTGTVAQILVMAIAAELPLSAPAEEREALLERVRSREIPSVVALFRLRVSEDAHRNQNPVLSGLRVDGADLPLGARVRLRPGGFRTLELTAPDEAFEVYEQLLPIGPEERTERLIAAWYSSYGTFMHPRIALRSEVLEELHAPDEKKEARPQHPEGTLWAVVRDTRGGQTWVEYPSYLCDPELPAPSVTAIEAGADPTLLAVEGENLSSVLDVVVGGRVLQGGSYSSSRQVFEGGLPELAAGEYPVQVLGKNCQDYDTGQVYRAP